MLRRGVQRTRELERIAQLPRRVLDFHAVDESYIDDLTNYLKTPLGTMRLRPIQALALTEMHDYGGLFGSIKVGGGKTLLSLLAPTVLEAERPLLLVPAKLRDKTRRELGELRKHWNIAQNLVIESYEMLGRVQGANTLEKVKPDLIIADECHRIKNPKAACTKRVIRYMRENLGTEFVALSGTITKRSIRDYHHILYWCFPQHAPQPKNFPDVMEWALAIDEKVDEFARLSPGALAMLYNSDEQSLSAKDARKAARLAYGRRLSETPGVVATSEKYTGSSLILEGAPVPLGKAALNALDHLREEWETPDGHPISDKVSMWRHAREIACGFYYVWSPRPPEHWLDARRELCKFVREVLKHNRSGLDSPLQVLQKHGEEPVVQLWRSVKDDFVPNVVPKWLDDSVLKYAAKWMQEHAGIVWVEHKAFGQKLSARTGVPYYADGGVNKQGQPIEAADFSKPVIASVASNAEGRNLQGWSKNLVISCPPTGIIWEQLLGRTHREGQQADEVWCEIILACAEQWTGLLQARADAKYLQDTLGQEQKLLHADWAYPVDPEQASLVLP